jgi:hypothetical protein
MTNTSLFALVESTPNPGSKTYHTVDWIQLTTIAGAPLLRT